jgi:hypothetical protein
MNEKEFVEKFGEKTFKYSESLIAGLNDHSWKITSITGGDKNKMTASAFHQIYGKKAANLNEPKDEYSVTLQNDLIDFCKNLEKLNDEIVDVVSFSDEASFINVFIQRSNQDVVGSIKTMA